MNVSTELTNLFIKHKYDTIGSDNVIGLMTTPSEFEEKVKSGKNGIPLNDLFFNGDFTVTLPSNRKLRKIMNLWRIPKGYQRHFVKSLEQQQSLLVALLKGEVDSQFIFGITPTETILNVIDSQQRLTILKRFFNNQLFLPEGTVLRFIGDEQGRTINCSNMKFDDFNNHPIYKLLMDSILNGVKCDYVIHEGPESLHRKVFNNLNTGNTSLSLMEDVTSGVSSVFDYVRDFNNFFIEYENVDDTKWTELKNLWDVSGLGGLRYDQCKLPLHLMCLEYFGYQSINKNHVLQFSKSQTVNQSWKDIFDIFIKLHTDVIKEKTDYDNRDLWGLGGWRTFLMFLRILYKQENISIKIKDYQKFWEFAQDMMKDLRTNLGMNSVTNEFVYDEMVKKMVNIKYFIPELIILWENKFSKYNTHDKFLSETGISLRDGNRQINWSDSSFIWQVQDGKCKKCGVRVSVHDVKDHIKEWSIGGSTDISNIQILCETCNKQKTIDFISTKDSQDTDDNSIDATDDSDE